MEKDVSGKTEPEGSRGSMLKSDKKHNCEIIVGSWQLSQRERTFWA